jgi:hypothetical protein
MFLPTPVSRASHYRLPIPMMIGEKLVSSFGSSTWSRSLSTYPGFTGAEALGSSPADSGWWPRSDGELRRLPVRRGGRIIAAVRSQLSRS